MKRTACFFLAAAIALCAVWRVHDAHAGAEILPCSYCGDTSMGYYVMPYQSGSRLYHKFHCESCGRPTGGEANCVAEAPPSNGYCKDLRCIVCRAIVVFNSHNLKGYNNIVEKQPTCTEAGNYTSRFCIKCGFVEEKASIPALGHDERILPAVPAGCMTTGITEGRECARCGLQMQTRYYIIPRGFHVPMTFLGKPSTCTEAGNTSITICMDCHEVLTAPIPLPLAEHTPVTDPAVPSNCLFTGLTEGSHCSVCGRVLVEPRETPLGAHDMSPMVIPEHPPCVKFTTTVEQICKVCGFTLTTAVVMHPTADHTQVIDPAVPATCTGTGLTEGSHCSVCNTVLLAQTVVDKLPHTEVIDAAVPASCIATGLTEGKHCSVCNEVLLAQTVVDKLPHTVVIDHAVAPTCEATGLTEGSHCGSCAEVFAAQEVRAALGHTWGKWVANPNGSHTRTCLTDPTHTQTRKFGLAAPAITSVTIAGATSLRVQWAADRSARGYELWMAEASGGPYRLIRALTDTSFTKTYLKAGSRYWFKVRSVTSEDGEKIFGLFGAHAAGVPIGRPAALQAVSQSPTRIRLTWVAAPGATGHLLSLFDAAKGAYVPLLHTVASDRIMTNLKPGKSYLYRLTPYALYAGVYYYGPAVAFPSVKTPLTARPPTGKYAK